MARRQVDRRDDYDAEEYDDEEMESVAYSEADGPARK